jgi:Uma2 family endonuclease
MPTTTLEPPVVSADTPVHRFTVRQYDRMTQDGAFDDAKVELLDGVIYDKMPHNAPHDSCVYRLHTRLLLMLAPLGAIVRCQSAVTFPTSVPEPDVAIVPGPESLYDEVRPDFRDLAVVIEVADTTLARDRGLKMKLYARAKVPVYWIVNLVDGVVEVYTDPRGGKTPAYRIRTDYKPGEAVPVAIGKKVVGSVPVSNLLP